MDNKILVVIPYLAKAAQGNELEIAVAGWRRFFKEPYHIVVVGDYHRVVGTGDDIEFINCPRIKGIPGQYTPHLDHVHKFRKVRDAFPETYGFIYTCDDIYPTADITMADILQPKRPEVGFEFEPHHPLEVSWRGNKDKTGILCNREGLPRRNWVCHLPVFYEWDKLLAIYDKFDCDHESYIVENIYFNIEYPDEPNAVNCYEYRDEVKTLIPHIRPIGSVKWITNGKGGWSRELAAILNNYFDIKPRI